jgi:hypothetical protein
MAMSEALQSRACARSDRRALAWKRLGEAELDKGCAEELLREIF